MSLFTIVVKRSSSAKPAQPKFKQVVRNHSSVAGLLKEGYLLKKSPCNA